MLITSSLTRCYRCRADRMIKYKIFIIELRKTICFLAAAADETKFLLSCTTYNLYKQKRWEGNFRQINFVKLHSFDKLTIFILYSIPRFN